MKPRRLLHPQERQHHAWGGGVAQPNTPETDAMPEVMHRVWVRFDDPTYGEKELRFMAADPCDAINRVNRMTTNEAKALIYTEAKA